MLDPISALAVATSAVQFLDFSTKLFSLIRNISQSKTGELEQYKHLKSMAERLSALNSCLVETITPQHLDRGLTTGELDIISISQECNEVADQLIRTLLEITPDKAIGKWSIVRRAVKSIWVQQDVERLELRMGECRQLLITSILINIQ
jgi:hypothetical protein